MTEIEKIVAQMTQQFEAVVKVKVSKERQKTVAAQTKAANWRARAQADRRELIALRKELRS
jgi:hypothetical protein